MNELNVELPLEIPVEEARLVLAAKLFELGRLSLRQAARMAGYSRPTFMELLGKMNIPVFNYPAEDLEQEISF